MIIAVNSVGIAVVTHPVGKPDETVQVQRLITYRGPRNRVRDVLARSLEDGAHEFGDLVIASSTGKEHAL